MHISLISQKADVNELFKPPRNETISDMLKFTCFPHFTWKSFITIISLIDIALFVAMLIYNGINYDGSFLEVTEKAIEDFGGK